MDDDIQPIDVSHLSDRMVRAAREFADLKFRVDTKGRRSPGDIPDDLHGPMSGGEYGPDFASGFFSAIIPFYPRNQESAKARILNVPVAHTLGCSWRWWADYITAESDDERIREHIFSDYGIGSTAYTWVPELGLCLPGEGKNRVNYCRHHKLEYIPARVYVDHYPSAERIKIYELHTAGGRDVWAILDNRYIQKVSHFVYALPLLNAYGVTVSREWPKELPAVSELLHYERHCTDDSLFQRKVIDTTAVRRLIDKAAEGEELVRTELRNLPIHRKFVLIGWLFLAQVVAVIAYLCFRSGVMGSVFLAALAFTSGIFAAFITPLVKTKKKYIER